VIPLSDGSGYRVAARHAGEDPLDVVTLVYKSEWDAPRELPHPMQWERSGSPPLACEVKVGDTLPAPRGHLGRPNSHLTDEMTRPLPQTVLRVALDPYTEQVQLFTRDGFQRTRRWKFDPEERVDFTRPRKRVRRAVRVTPPEVFEGPFCSPTGALWVFQQRHPHGGRQPKDAATYDPTLPPLLHPDTQEPIPYVILWPPRGTELVGHWRDPVVFSDTARRMPEVQYILRSAGLLPGEGDPDPEEASEA
jgi:hypothetical protein